MEDVEQLEHYIKIVNLVLDNPANNLTTTSISLLNTMCVSLRLDIAKLQE